MLPQAGWAPQAKDKEHVLNARMLGTPLVKAPEVIKCIVFYAKSLFANSFLGIKHQTHPQT